MLEVIRGFFGAGATDEVELKEDNDVVSLSESRSRLLGAPAFAFGVFALVFAFSSAFSSEESVSAAGSVFDRHVPVLIEQEGGEG